MWAAILQILAAILGMFRNKMEQDTIILTEKNKEEMKEQKKAQDVVTERDKNEEVIGQVVNAKTEKEREEALDEIRKVIGN